MDATITVNKPETQMGLKKWWDNLTNKSKKILKVLGIGTVSALTVAFGAKSVQKFIQNNPKIKKEIALMLKKDKKINTSEDLYTDLQDNTKVPKIEIIDGGNGGDGDDPEKINEGDPTTISGFHKRKRSSDGKMIVRDERNREHVGAMQDFFNGNETFRSTFVEMYDAVNQLDPDEYSSDLKRELLVYLMNVMYGEDEKELALSQEYEQTIRDLFNGTLKNIYEKAKELAKKAKARHQKVKETTDKIVDKVEKGEEVTEDDLSSLLSNDDAKEDLEEQMEETEQSEAELEAEIEKKKKLIDEIKENNSEKKKLQRELAELEAKLKSLQNNK